MYKKIKELLLVIIITLVPTLLIWIPFFFRLEKFWTIPLPLDGMATIVANYDGPLFIVIAKTLYNIADASGFPISLPVEYYAAHFPLFPLLIRIISYVLGYPYAMLAVTLISSVTAVYFFRIFIQDYVNKKDIFWITFVFSVFPARWLIVRSVGSAEPLFLAATIASVYYFNKRKYISAGIWGGLAMLTKSPGILLFVAYFFTVTVHFLKGNTGSKLSEYLSLKPSRYLPLLVIPLTLVGLFIFYYFRFGDFFAYFKSGDNIHLFFPPFQIFNYSQPWVGTFWLEEVIFVYLIIVIGLMRLIKKSESKLPEEKYRFSILTWYVGIFFASLIFVSHRDIVRYSLPLVPFLFAGYSDLITKKEFKVALAVIIIPVYLFSLAYISQNVMPITNWAPLL